MHSHDIKPLAKCFLGRGEVKGYLFTQISKTDKAFIYEVSSGNAKHHIVFKYKINKRYGCVSYPTSKAFGIWAWTCMTLASAIKKFNELNESM
jgi:hypothetical protein